MCQLGKRNGCRQLTNTTVQVSVVVPVTTSQITFQFSPVHSGKRGCGKEKGPQVHTAEQQKAVTKVTVHCA